MRPCFLSSIMVGGPAQITPPLISKTTGLPTIVTVAPTLDAQNPPQGLVGAGIWLKYIRQIAKELKAGRTGYGFIAAPNGTSYTTPRLQLGHAEKIQPA